MSTPAVSIVVPTFNSLEMLKECLGSVFNQTLPQPDIELIVVDDGSTDGTWDYLQSLRSDHPNLVALRQENSGRPSVGRNHGMDSATGEFIFFLDSDDWFSPESLERMVSVARGQGSDVVVGLAVGEDRQVRQRDYLNTVYDADLLDDGAWRTLSPWKLFRTSLVRCLGIRFPEDMVQGEDQVFVSQCYFAAGKVSTLADYDYYHVRGRVDGGNISQRPQSLRNKLLTVTRMAEIIVSNTEPGPRRRRHFRRVILRTLAPGLGKPFMAAPAEEREEFLRRIRQDVLPNMHSRDLAAAADRPRLRLAIARNGASAQLATLNEKLADGPVFAIMRGLPHLDLGPELNAIVPPELRQVRDVWKLRHRFESLSSRGDGLAVTYRFDPRQFRPQVLSLMPPELVFTSRGASPVTVSVAGSRLDDFRWQFAWGADLLGQAPAESTIWDARLVVAGDSHQLASGRAVYRDAEGPSEARAVVLPAPNDGTAIWLEAYTTVGGNLSVLQGPRPKKTAIRAASIQDGSLDIVLPTHAGAVRRAALLTAEGRLPLEFTALPNGRLTVILPGLASFPAESAEAAEREVLPLVLEIDCELTGCQIPLSFDGNSLVATRWPAHARAAADPSASRLAPKQVADQPGQTSQRPTLPGRLLSRIRSLQRHTRPW